MPFNPFEKMKFNSNLIHWYTIYKRNLPWRQSQDPYSVWLSEIILQQTQIKQGLPYYMAFIEKYPTVFDLAQANETEVLKLWQGLGYYSRARNLHFTAKLIAFQNNGVFPNSYKELMKLKGVGDYTASAIASICFDEAVAVLDGNVFRVLARYFGIDTPINSTEGVKQFKALAQTLIPNQNIGDYNQAIMEFGALQCKPKSPKCEQCPLQNNCNAYATATVKLLPVKLKKITVQKRYYNFMVIVSKDQTTLLEKRTQNGIWKNLYQFPLIESKTSISKEELQNLPVFKSFYPDLEFDIHLHNSTDIIHKLSHRELHIKFWILKHNGVLNNGINFSEINQFPVPVVLERFIERFDP